MNLIDITARILEIEKSIHDLVCNHGVLIGRLSEAKEMKDKIEAKESEAPVEKEASE